MECPDCGKIIDSETNFCIYCGRPIKAQSVGKTKDGGIIYRLSSGIEEIRPPDEKKRQISRALSFRLEPLKEALQTISPVKEEIKKALRNLIVPEGADSELKEDINAFVLAINSLINSEEAEEQKNIIAIVSTAIDILSYLGKGDSL